MAVERGTMRGINLGWYDVTMFRSTFLLAGLLSTGSGFGDQAQSLRAEWLQGCWEARSPGLVIEENWTAPRGGVMIGISRTVRRDSLIEYELVLLRESGGVITYEAHPSRQPLATFTATEATNSTIVFANPSHDYPQQVGYRRVGSDSLVAWIDGQRDGRSRRAEFPLRERAASDGREAA